MQFTLREAVESDAEAISDLVTGWARRHLADPPPAEAAEFLASLAPAPTAGRIVAEEFAYYVASDDDGLCGVIAIQAGTRVYHLFVRADAHGRGIGRALWEHARAASGSTTFVVNSAFSAVPVYERFGFVAQGEPQSARGLTFVRMEYSETVGGGASARAGERGQSCIRPK